MDTTAVRDHHDLFASFAKAGHYLVDILAKLLGVKMGNDLIEHFQCPILDSANDADHCGTWSIAPLMRTQPFRLKFPWSCCAEAPGSRQIGSGTKFALLY